MAKVTDFTISSEINDIMKQMATKHAHIFPGFDVQKVGVTHNNTKTDAREPLKVIAVRYPHSAWMEKTYLVDVAQKTWTEMNDRQKRLAVFHAMCYMPEGAFDETSKNYGGKRRPDIQMFSEEYAITGGVPNWMENEEAKDPLEEEQPKKTKHVQRVPVTAEAIATP